MMIVTRFLLFYSWGKVQFHFNYHNVISLVGSQTCQMWLTVIICSFRWFEHAQESFLKVPLLGPVSYLTLAISPFCLAFAIMWAVFRHVSFAWIGQDILVRTIIILHLFPCNFLYLSLNPASYLHIMQINCLLFPCFTWLILPTG